MNDVFDGHFNKLIQTYSPDTTPMALLLCRQQTLEMHIHFRHRFPKDLSRRVELLNPVFVPST